MAVCNRAPGPAVKPRPDAPIKLMYGVPPARFEKMEAPEKQLKKE